MMRNLALTFAALVSLIAGHAAAYDIRPVAGVHEAFTRLAEQCRREANGQQPRDCLALSDQVANWTGRQPDSDSAPLQRAVRWADDPLRQLSSTSGVIRYGRLMSRSCPRLVLESAAIDRISLVCASHFGPLQFFHAMASSNSETPAQTRARILDWADLTYRIATGAVPLSTDMCDYFRRNRSDISASFAVEDLTLCTPGDEREWTLAVLFGQRCDSATSTDNCERLGEAAAMEAVRGALIHVIQDSYSQSHAVRGRPPTGGYQPRVVCRLPTGFYNYLGQDGHGRADSRPEFDQTCGPGAEADDVITASAMALHFLDRRAPAAEFSCYLQARVFGARTVWANPDPRARYDCRA
jgi:hypothetical protein